MAAATALTLVTLGPNALTADPAGATPDASNGNSVSGAKLEKIVLRVHNGDSGSHTCTVKAGVYPPAESAGQGDLAVAVAASATKWIGPFTSARFAQKDGSLLMTWDASTSITVTAFTFAQAG